MKISQVLFYLAVSFIFSSCKSEQDEKFTELVDKGTLFLENKNYSSALVCFRDAMNYDLSQENESKNYRNIAVSQLFLQEIDSAKYYFKKGFESISEDTYYHLLNKGEYYLLTNRTKEALIILKKAEKTLSAEGNNTNIEVYNNLSLIYSGSYGEEFLNLNAALENALKAYRLKKTDINQEQLASVYFQKESFQHATELFKDLFDRHPEVKIYQFYYGQSLFFSGKEEKGIELMENAAERDELCKKMFEQIVDIEK